MFMFLLGLMDILAGLFLFGTKFSIFTGIAWFFFLYLLVKSMIFIKNLSSWIDLVVAGLFFFALIGHFNVLTAVGSLWLLQKGFLSLL